MERAGPRQIDVLTAEGRRGDPLHSPDHLLGGSAGKRQKQDAVRINPIDEKMSNPVGKGLRLPGAGPSNHRERRGFHRRFTIYAMLDGATLFLVQISQIVGGHDCQPLLIRSPTVMTGVRPARSIFSSALNFFCSAIATLVCSPCGPLIRPPFCALREGFQDADSNNSASRARWRPRGCSECRYVAGAVRDACCAAADGGAPLQKRCRRRLPSTREDNLLRDVGDVGHLLRSPIKGRGYNP